MGEIKGAVARPERGNDVLHGRRWRAKVAMRCVVRGAWLRVGYFPHDTIDLSMAFCGDVLQAVWSLLRADQNW